MEQEKQPLFSVHEKNVQYLKKLLGTEKSFDLIHLDLEYVNRRTDLFLIDGFAKDDILHYLMAFLAKLEPADVEPDVLEKLLKSYIPYIELDQIDDLNQAADVVLAGPTILLMEGLDKIIVID